MATPNANSSTSNLPQKTYGRIIITLENCLYPHEKLQQTPSATDGLDNETELDLRILGCELIQTAGILLKLPQVAMATGQVLFQRFFYAKSFVKYNMEIVAMGCVCLASKIEEAPRRIRDVINVFHHIKQVRGSKPIQPMIPDQNYVNLKNQVIKAERRVLKELGFCVHVKHPHKLIVTILHKVLDCEDNTKLTQVAWNYMNDSLRTNVFMRYRPETIACACIYLSARILEVPLPNKPAWYEVFDVTENDVAEICRVILQLYARKKPDCDTLEKIVEDLKQALQEAKMRAKGLTDGGTPQPSSSPNSRSNSPVRIDKSPSETLNRKEKKDGLKSRDSCASSPVTSTEANHVSQKRSHSPGSSNNSVSKVASSNHTPTRSRSRSPINKKKSRTPPRGYKDVRKSPSFQAEKSSNNSSNFHSRSRSRSHSVDRRDKSRSHKRKRASKSRSPHSPIQSSSSHHHHNHKKSSHRDKSSRHRSRSRSREHNFSSYDKLYSSSNSRSRKDRSRDNGHHRSRSRERNRR